jgi:hypothetical protein
MGARVKLLQTIDLFFMGTLLSAKIYLIRALKSFKLSQSPKEPVKSSHV